MIKYLSILLLVLCSSCHTPAWLGEMQKISRTKYVPLDNDCVDKAQAFQAWSKARGERNDILHVTMGGRKNTHAVNYIVGYVVDCTRGQYYKIWETVEDTIEFHYGGRILEYYYEEKKEF